LTDLSIYEIIINVERQIKIHKENKTMANGQQETKVITGKVRLSYVNLFKPRAASEDAEPKYSACLLIPKTDKNTVDKINKAIEVVKRSEAAKAKWGGKVPNNIKIPLRDGDEDHPEKAEFCGMYFLNANCLQKPGIIDLQKIEIVDSTEVYSGCYARASVNFYAFNRSGNKGIACGLNNIQKVADGENLGGRASAEDDFSDDYQDVDPLA
jgi:hypothetical protein